MARIGEILETVAQLLDNKGIDALLIGGFAVNHYGYTRNTLDVDFMVAVNDIVHLVLLHEINVTKDLKELCERFANDKVYSAITEEIITKKVMKFPIISQVSPKLPRSLTLEEYVEFLDFFMKDADPKRVAAQKKREEQISVAFSLFTKNK